LRAISLPCVIPVLGMTALISAAMPMFCAESCVFAHFDGFFGVLAAGGICSINGEINNYFSC
ncbi:hypothetical protein ACTVNK_09770, partial [Serratia nevei]